jgi:hypothetical protein
MPIQEGTLPDPQITFQNMAVSNPILGNNLQSNNFAYFGYGFSQEIPFPGKLRLRASVADKEAAGKIGRDGPRLGLRSFLPKTLQRVTGQGVLPLALRTIGRNFRCWFSLLTTAAFQYRPRAFLDHRWLISLS